MAILIRCYYLVSNFCFQLKFQFSRLFICICIYNFEDLQNSCLFPFFCNSKHFQKLTWLCCNSPSSTFNFSTKQTLTLANFPLVFFVLYDKPWNGFDFCLCNKTSQAGYCARNICYPPAIFSCTVPILSVLYERH